MPELFSAEWDVKFKELWNSGDGIMAQLRKSRFNSVVAFGLDGEDQPRCVLTVSEGQLVSIGAPAHETIVWDLRAKMEDWQDWMKKPPSLMKLGLAYTTRKLKFNKGDYAAMIKEPGLSGAFVKCFELMSKAALS
ncbi:MAG: SCP-2 sterol transfer family protein [Gammaproteobacteria bacterium]|nr:SCP-2 sterol transfer family protein [Gammaproteobacteria bacterium]MDH5735262.1 SCP-2 sterol transfer family protein [Gammaproteobacteria bacterium]